MSVLRAACVSAEKELFERTQEAQRKKQMYELLLFEISEDLSSLLHVTVPLREEEEARRQAEEERRLEAEAREQERQRKQKAIEAMEREAMLKVTEFGIQFPSFCSYSHNCIVAAHDPRRARSVFGT